MTKKKQPATKRGGKKKCAPKKAIKRAIKKAEKAIAEGRVLTERQADQLAADKMRADSFASTQPKHPTVEEHFDRDVSLMQALHDPENQPSQYGTVPMSYLDNQKPGLLRRAWNRVKRVFRYRSAETGLFVSKKHAEANPNTTVRERVKP